MSAKELDNALVHATERRDAATVEKLIQAGANVNTTIRCWETHGDCDWDYYETPFMYAAGRGDLDTVKVLLKFKGKLNETVDQAFDAAVRGTSCEVVEELLKAGANVHQLDQWGRTPLMLAVERANPKVVETLLKAGANPNHVNKDGETPLLVAAKWTKGRETTEALLKKGARLDCVDKNGNTPLIIATRNKRREVVEALLKAGADAYHANKQGRTALMEAVLEHDVDTVLNLLKVPGMNSGSFFGFFGEKPIDHADEDGNTALIHAVKNIEQKFTYFDNRGYQAGLKLCKDTQAIAEALLKTPGIDHHHVNKKGESAVALLNKLKANSY